MAAYQKPPPDATSSATIPRRVPSSTSHRRRRSSTSHRRPPTCRSSSCARRGTRRRRTIGPDTRTVRSSAPAATAASRILRPAPTGARRVRSRRPRVRVRERRVDVPSVPKPSRARRRGWPASRRASTPRSVERADAARRQSAAAGFVTRERRTIAEQHACTARARCAERSRHRPGPHRRRPRRSAA